MQKFLDHQLQNKMNLYMKKIKASTVNLDDKKVIMTVVCSSIYTLHIPVLCYEGKYIFLALECLINYLNYIYINKSYKLNTRCWMFALRVH